jgi:hypothetical protein
MGTPPDPSNNTFATMRQSILQALEQAEVTANQRAEEIIREAEERARGITREHERKVSEIESALLSLRGQVDEVLQQLAQFRNPNAPRPATRVEALDMGHPLQPDAVTFHDPAQSPEITETPAVSASPEPLDVLDPLQPDAVTPVDETEETPEIPDPLQPDAVAPPEFAETVHADGWRPSEEETVAEEPERWTPTPWPRTSEEVARELAALSAPKPPEGQSANAEGGDPDGPEETIRALRAALSALHASDPPTGERSED